MFFDCYFLTQHLKGMVNLGRINESTKKWDKENFGKVDKQMGYDLQISGEYSTNLFIEV